MENNLYNFWIYNFIFIILNNICIFIYTSIFHKENRIKHGIGLCLCAAWHKTCYSIKQRRNEVIMQKPQTIYSYGNDKRQKYLGNMLAEYGFTVINVQDATKGHVNKNNMPLEQCGDISGGSEILLLPVAVPEETLAGIIPFIHNETYIIGGVLPDYLTDICSSEHAMYLDYMKIPEIAIQNAVATAEGAICEAIKAGSINIQSSKCLVIGYGRCGTVIADKLSCLKADVSILTIESEDIARAAAGGYTIATGDFGIYDFIFNTAPALTITPGRINTMKGSCIIIDIASKPGGTDFSYCKSRGITAKHCLGLPAAYAPKTSAKIIFDEIIKYI